MTEKKPLYYYSRETADARGELGAWRESYRENCDCARKIELTIRDNYRDNRLGNGCAEQLIDEYGFNRINWVLANTLQRHDSDGRYSRENLDWAKRFPVPDDEARWRFCVNAHPGLVNLLINQVRRQWQSLGLFDRQHVDPGIRDYDGRVLVIKPEILKEEYRKPEYQLFYAKGGFGCREESLGTKVTGFFISDGENASCPRSDFLGVIRDEFIPDWAGKNIERYLSPETTDGMRMGD